MADGRSVSCLVLLQPFWSLFCTFFVLCPAVGRSVGRMAGLMCAGWLVGLKCCLCAAFCQVTRRYGVTVGIPDSDCVDLGSNTGIACFFVSPFLSSLLCFALSRHVLISCCSRFPEHTLSKLRKSNNRMNVQKHGRNKTANTSVIVPKINES